MIFALTVWFVLQLGLTRHSAQVLGEDVHEYCQLETFSARCHHGDVIVMTTARFGRMRVGKCIDGGEQSAALEEALQKVDPNSLGCYANVLDYADRTCSGKTACDIAVPNHDLLSTRPCLSQLTMYLEAAFHCVSVIEDDRSCTVIVTAELRQHIRSSTENSGSGQQRLRCGSVSHPWLLEAQTGQQVNISLLDFTGHDLRTQLDTSGLVSDDCSPVYVQYGYIVDKRNKKNVSICSTATQQRHKHVYLSEGNSVDIAFTANPTQYGDERLPENFLLAFEAVGCSNLVPPSDAWLRRTDNEATIGCYTTRQRWNLRCHGNQWTGTVGVCSTNQGDTSVKSSLYRPIVEAKTDDSNFINVLLIVSVSLVGLAVCLVIIFVGFGCARRYGFDKMSTGGRQHLVGSYKDDPMIAGQRDSQYTGQTHNELLPQYFVLNNDAVGIAN